MLDSLIFALIILVLNIILAILPKVPLLNIVVGLFSFSIGAFFILGNADFPFQPYFSLIFFFVPICSLLSAAYEFKETD